VRFVGWLVVLGACGRLDFDPSGARLGDGGAALTDGGADGSPLLGPDAAPCVPGPWGTPVALPGINSAADELGPWLSPDGLELFLSVGGLFTADIYRSVRSARSDPFPLPTLQDELSSASTDFDPMVSEDGLTLWLSHVGSGGTNYVTEASRPDRSTPFESLVPHFDLSDSSNEYGPTVDASQLTILFATTRLGSEKIMRAERADTDDLFELPEFVSELDSFGNDRGPSLRRDGLQLLLASTVTLGGPSRLRIADAVGDTFTTPQDFAPTAADGEQVDPSWVGDGRAIVYASDQAGGAGGYDLYMIERTCL